MIWLKFRNAIADVIFRNCIKHGRRNGCVTMKTTINFLISVGCNMQELLSKPQTIQILREHRISPTIQRVEIAQILLSKSQHLSAEQVLEYVNSDRAKVSKATVYNTLGLFARKGLVKELIVDPSKVFYDSNVTDHHHFFNVETGELRDIETDCLSLGQLPNLPEGTVAAGIDVIIRVKQMNSAA